MKLQLSIFVTLLVLSSFAEAQKSVSQLLTDRRYVTQQISCILDQAPCDVIGKRIKSLLPEALNNNCRRCTPRQREHARTLMTLMQQNYPKEWQMIVRYYSTVPNRITAM
ncbi:allergen Tha p 1 [Megalopta genalis]|uniref:allergen Tha p 1 n=1 Tax=Megalopta genalis TaxID=115081 RepID=UPI00144316DB|nr:ejaculatory bulb-specific protein 3-like [Megalopta genalis]